MKTIHWIASCLILLALAGCNGVNQRLVIEDGEVVDRDLSNINGSIRVGAECEVTGEVSNINGSIQIGSDSRIGESISNINGHVALHAGVEVGGDVSSTNGHVEIGEGAVVQGTVNTTNGRIELAQNARVDGGVSTTNGRIRLTRAEVGSITSHNGDVELLEGSTVQGELNMKKSGGMNLGDDPEVIIGRDVTVAGPLVFEREVTLRIHESAEVGEINGAEPEFYSGDSP